MTVPISRQYCRSLFHALIHCLVVSVVWLHSCTSSIISQAGVSFRDNKIIRWDPRISRVAGMRDNLLKSLNAIEEKVVKLGDINRTSYEGMVAEISAWFSSSFLSSEASDSYSIPETVKLASKYLSQGAQWEYMGIENDVTVWKLKPSSINMRHDEKQWPCVKSSTIIKMDPKSLIEYLMDSSKVPEYNKYCAGRTDVEKISKRSKIVWNRTCIPLVIKSYDFCTLMHYYIRSPQNEYVLVSRGVQHPLIPVHKDYCRSENIIGLNILRPIKSNKNVGKEIHTEIICIGHVKYGGGTLPYLIQKSLFRGTVKYLHNLKEKIHNKL